MFCRECGAENSETASYCLRCGAKLAGPDTSKWWDDRRVWLAVVILTAVILISTAAIVIMALRPVSPVTPEATSALSTGPAPATTAALSVGESEGTTPALPDELGTSNLYLEYILDASGSMNEPLPDGSIKIQVARDLLSEHLQAFRPQTNIGLCAYGHRVDYRHAAESCQDIELIAPVEQGQLESIASWLRSFQAQGMTPLEESIRMAMEDFSFELGRINSIVMISDGEETCDGDPCGLVEEMKAQGINLTIHVIGLDVDESTREQLLCIAGAGGGTYHDARSAEELEEALDAVKNVVRQDELIVLHRVDAPTPILPTDTPTPAITPSVTPASEQDPLTPALVAYQPAGCPPVEGDGTILFWEHASVMGGPIYTMKPDGSGLRELGGGLDPQWSLDGRYIAYRGWTRDTDAADIYIMNADGSQPRKLTSAPPGTAYEFPGWSPDGKRLNYFFWGTDPDDLKQGTYVIDLDGTNEWRVTDPFGESPSHLFWSPDGQKIAFAIENTDSHNRTLYVTNADGSGRPRKLEEGWGVWLYDYIAWAPDTQRIMFGVTDYDYSTESGSTGVYVVDADGTGRSKVLDLDFQLLNAYLSPCGTHFAYPRYSGDSEGLHVMKADGTERVWLLPAPFWFLDWSPDGTRLLVGVEQDDGREELLIISIDGTGLHRISPDEYGVYIGASWVPWASSP